MSFRVLSLESTHICLVACDYFVIPEAFSPCAKNIICKFLKGSVSNPEELSCRQKRKAVTFTSNCLRILFLFFILFDNSFFKTQKLALDNCKIFSPKTK